MFELEMITVPAGFFLRGADGMDYNDCYEAEESPKIKLWVDEYKIQKYPITVGQWLFFLEDSKYEWPKEEWIKVCKEKHIMPEVRDDLPIVCVSWYDAKAFADWLTVKTGIKYSLPTESQWEKACRGCDGQYYPWGNIMGDWGGELMKETLPEEHWHLQVIGKRKDRASPFGCEEMWCNVQEWCDDWFVFNFTNPEDPNNDSDDSKNKVCRGGSTIASGWPRCTVRIPLEPNVRHYILGFRLVSNRD
jgi:formylglycine-generating enzyme required for sulfatase activity